MLFPILDRYGGNIVRLIARLGRMVSLISDICVAIEVL